MLYYLSVTNIDKSIKKSKHLTYWNCATWKIHYEKILQDTYYVLKYKLMIFKYMIKTI